MVVFIRGFQWSEPSQQLLTSLPISSKHVIPICYGENLEVKFSSDSGTGNAQMREASVSAFPENSGVKAGMGLLSSITALSNAIRTLKKLKF